MLYAAEKRPWRACWLRHSCRRWPSVYQLLDGRIYPKIEALEGACPKQHEVTRLAKHDIVRRSFALGRGQRQAPSIARECFHPPAESATAHNVRYRATR